MNTWGSIPLVDLLLVCDSGTWGEPSDSIEGVGVLRSTNINKWRLDLSGDVAYRRVSARDLQNKRLQAGDIIVTKSSGSSQLIGEAALFDTNVEKIFLFSNFTQRLRPDKQKILPKYLHYYLSSPLGREVLNQMHRTTSGLRNLVISKYLEQNIPIPNPGSPEKSLLMQERIIYRLEQFLGEHNLARRLHEKIVADTNRLMDAVLAEYFPRFGVALPDGWDWKPISFLAHDRDRQNPSLIIPNEYFNYIDISSVDNAIGAVTDPKRLLGQDAPSRARKIVHTNDVIFATTRPYLKNIALIPSDLDHAICSTGFCVLVPKLDYCTPQYLFYAARSESIIQQLIPKQRGASYPAVLDQDIFNSYIPVPYPGDPERSKATQDMAAKRIFEMEASISEAQEDNAKTELLLDQMEQSILAQAFRGEL